MSSSDDRSVLLELFRATNGPSWFYNDGWDTNASVSTWYGVTVDKGGRVVKLDLRSNNLEGAIPESLGQLNNLTRLNLSSNKLTGTIAESLGQLTNLTELNLSSNKLTGAIPESLGKITNLAELNLSSNGLTGAIPESLGKITNLEELYLSYTNLTGAIPESLGQLSNLTRLNLSSNKLTGAIPESLGQLTNLAEMNLSLNGLTGAIPESLGQITNLAEMNLSYTKLTGTIPESLGQLTNLTRLNLSSNKLTGAIPESLGQLTNLAEMNLSYTNLTGAIPESLGKLTNLTRLNLSSNKLTGAIPESLGQLSNLTRLYLSSNGLTGAIPESLGKITKLTELNLSSNKLTGVIPESLGQITNLAELNLSSTNLTGAIPESLGQLTNLTRLNLSSNKLTGVIPESLGQITNLAELNLSSTNLTGAIPESLGQITNLTRLNLSYTNFTGAIPESLGQITNLAELNLSSNKLTGAIPESLGQLTKLIRLNLSSNQLTVISEEAARELQRLGRWRISLENNPWTNPPGDVVDGGYEAIVGYWEAIARSGAIESWKLKVVLVGAVKAGKTSLVKSMIHGQPHLCGDDNRTKGVDVHVGEPFKPDAERKLELIFWDFAGHSEYSSTHQLFLSKGALNLLVVDLKRFSDDPPARGELVDVWLDALQCRVPGSNVLVVATQTDLLIDDLEGKLGDLRRRVESHLSAQRICLERARCSSSASTDIQQSLIFHGVQATSSAHVESLMDLRFNLSKLVYTKRKMFPSVGLRRPVSWARVAAMLNAKQSGKDFLLQVSSVGAAKQNQGELKKIPAGVKFIHRTKAKDDWRMVVETLKLENEVGQTERNSENVVFEDAVGQLVREGMVVDSGEILYLEPVWINGLLRAILDHDLADVEKDNFWKDELKTFSDRNNKIFYVLKRVHDNFPSTGILTVRYLRFLWRHVPEVSDDALFSSLISTMSHHGIVFGGNPSGAGSEHAVNASENNAELFVPLHLPSKILESELGIETLLKHQFQKEMVYEICQTYIPPGLLGMLMARFLHSKGVEFCKCWSRGAIFTLDEVLVLLLLNTPSHEEDEACIKVTLFGDRFVSELKRAVKRVEKEVTSVFFERFPGVLFNLKGGRARDVDVNNVVVARISGLEEHLNRELSDLLQSLHQLEDNLQDVAKSCYLTLARLNKLQSGEVPCPNLVFIRPAAAMVPGRQKRSLRAMVEGLSRRAKKLGRKDMRLCFRCPYDFSEVPCGLDGNGYPYEATRDWVAKIRPALKVTALLTKMAIRVASGVDLPVPDILNETKSYLGEELADRVLEDGAIERALDGSAVPVEEGEVKALVGKAYEELKQFMEMHEYQGAEGYVHFDKVMQLVDDGDGGKVWVSKGNVKLWKKTRP